MKFFCKNCIYYEGDLFFVDCKYSELDTTITCHRTGRLLTRRSAGFTVIRNGNFDCSFYKPNLSTRIINFFKRACR